MIPALPAPFENPQSVSLFSNAERGGSAFTDALSRAVSRSGSSDVSAVAPDLTPRQAAEELVANAFVEPILASMRKMNQAAAPFAPAAAEKQFAPLLDAIFAQQIVRSGRFGLVDAVARQVQGSAPAGPAQAVDAGAAHTNAERAPHAQTRDFIARRPR